MSLRALLAWSWTLVILGLCWLPRTYIPEDERAPRMFLIPHLDKMIHLGIFAVFAWLWMRVGSSPRRGRWVLLGGVALAVISELGQELPIVSRDASIFDGLADSLGVIVGIVAHEVVGRLVARRAVRPEA